MQLLSLSCGWRVLCENDQIYRIDCTTPRIGESMLLARGLTTLKSSAASALLKAVKARMGGIIYLTPLKHAHAGLAAYKPLEARTKN